MGFRKFVLDKIVRLGGPFVIYSVLLGPAMDLWISSCGGVSVLSWQYIMGPPWFVLWLLNFSLIYAAVAHIAPKGRQCASPRPLLVVGGALALAAVLCPCFWGLSLVLGEWQFLGGMVLVIRDLRLRPRFLWWRRRRPAWLAQLRGGDEDMVCVGLARDVPSILDSDPVGGSQREHLVPSICFRHHWRIWRRHASVRHGHEFGHPPTFPSVFQRTAEYAGPGCGPGSLHGLRHPSPGGYDGGHSFLRNHDGSGTVADICSVRLPRCCLLRIGREL